MKKIDIQINKAMLTSMHINSLDKKQIEMTAYLDLYAAELPAHNIRKV